MSGTAAHPDFRQHEEVGKTDVPLQNFKNNVTTVLVKDKSDHEEIRILPRDGIGRLEVLESTPKPTYVVNFLHNECMYINMDEMYYPSDLLEIRSRFRKIPAAIRCQGCH